MAKTAIIELIRTLDAEQFRQVEALALDLVKTDKSIQENRIHEFYKQSVKTGIGAAYVSTETLFELWQNFNSHLDPTKIDQNLLTDMESFAKYFCRTILRTGKCVKLRPGKITGIVLNDFYYIVHNIDKDEEKIRERICKIYNKWSALSWGYEVENIDTGEIEYDLKATGFYQVADALSMVNRIDILSSIILREFQTGITDRRCVYKLAEQLKCFFTEQEYDKLIAEMVAHKLTN